MWSQVRDANWRVPYVGGWCLKYVQDAFGTDHPYPSAMAAWNANYGNCNHPNEQPPAGKTVAVYFSLGNVPEGHVAIALDDGSVASSTQPGSHAEGYIHPNLQDLINIYGKYNGGCKYLGWSEYVGTVHVLQPLVVNATQDQINQAYLDILGRPADDDGLSHYSNYTNDFVRADLLASNERKIYVAAQAVAAARAIADKQAADAKAIADAKAAADAEAQAAKDAQAAADSASAKQAQDVKDAQALADAQAADAKKRDDAAVAQTNDSGAAKLTLIQLIINLLKQIFNIRSN